MKDFLEDNLMVIIFLIILISIVIFAYKAIDREYEFYEKVLEYGIESNTAVEIK